VSKSKECITNATQLFVVEASILARNWHDKVDNFQEVRKRALELVLELGPLFEEEKEKTTEAGNESNSEPKEKKEQQSNPKTTKKMKT
jgi:hypothetical protein